MAYPVTIWKLYPSSSSPTGLERVLLTPPPTDFNEASLRLPEGVYTTFRTYTRRNEKQESPSGRWILPLEDHLLRLETSARLIGFSLALDFQLMYEVVHFILARCPAGEARLRISIDLQMEIGVIYVACEVLALPTDYDYTHGVLAVTRPFHRENPRSKRTTFIEVARVIRQDLPPEINEALLFDEHGQILEGLNSNFFGVQEGQLWTAAEGVLEGITRKLVIQAAHDEGFPVHMESIAVTEIPRLDEAFLTSSSRSILPIRQIDGYLVGNGLPGPVTRRLMILFWELLEARLVPI